MIKVWSILGYLAMLGGVLGLIATGSLLALSWPVIGAQAAAAGLMIWARICFGRRSFHLVADPTAGGLVTTGPYRLIRHPIYASLCLFCGAGVAAHGSWSAALFGALVLAGAVVRILCEEVLVPLKYPEYRAYAARTWRMIPFLF